MYSLSVYFLREQEVLPDLELNFEHWLQREDRRGTVVISNYEFKIAVSFALIS